MSLAEFAALLTGATYGEVVSPELIAMAKAEGLVIVYGQSDDLMEFRGAIHDQAHSYNDEPTWFDRAGCLSAPGLGLEDANEVRDYLARKSRAVSIESHWSPAGEYCWTYRTDIPHEVFEVTEDEGENKGDPYCRGIVFALADVPAGPLDYVCECCASTHAPDEYAAACDGWRKTRDGWVCPCVGATEQHFRL